MDSKQYVSFVEYKQIIQKSKMTGNGRQCN